MLLNEIKEKLKEIDPVVCYGKADKKLVDKAWNYIVFNRTKLTPSQNKTGYTDGFEVHIIREEFIPEGLDLQVIDKMLEISGVRLETGDHLYQYSEKPNTNMILEILTLRFARARK